MIINIIILLIGAYLNLHTETAINLQGNELTNYAGYMNDQQNGYYIDESIGYTGKCFYTEDISLKRGIYRITASYQTDTADHTITVAGGTGYNGLLADTLKLTPTDGVASSIVWLNKNTDDFHVEWNYGGTGTLACNGLSITQVANTSGMLYLILIMGLIDGVIYLYLRNKKNPFQTSVRQTVFVLVIVSVMASLPLTEPFLNEGADLMFHLMRIEGIKEGMQAGQFPVFIQPNWLQGYGYDVSVFYSDFFLYIPAFLAFFRVPIQACYKFYLIIVNILTAVIAYKTVHKITKDRYAGYLGTVLYTLSSYRLICIYKRGAVGEYTAMTVLPLLIYAFYRIFTEDQKADGYKRYWMLPTIGFTVLMQSHLLSCEMVGIFVFITCLILWKKTFSKETFLVLAKTVIATGILNLGYLVPFLSYSKLDLCILHNWGGKSIQEGGINLVEMLNPFFGGNISYGPGFVLVLGLVLFIYLWMCKDKTKLQGMPQYKVSLLFTGLGALALFMATNLFPYDGLMIFGKAYELLAKVQFPFRYLSIAIPFLTLASCFAVLFIRELKGKTSFKIAVVGMMILSMVSALYYYSTLSYKAQEQTVVYDEAGLDSMYIEGHEYMYTDVDMDNFTAGTVQADEGVNLISYQKQYTNVNMTVENTVDTEASITLPMFLWPGFEARDISTGEELQLQYAEQMLMQVVLPAGYQGSIYVSFHTPVIWRVAEAVSVITAAAILAMMFSTRKRKNQRVIHE